MPYRVYLIGIRWIKTPMNTSKIETLLSGHGDWLRWNGYTWLYFTKLSASQIYEILRIHLHNDDSTLVLKVDPAEY